MYLRSGDIMIMARNSRLAYHAVPRILSPPTYAGAQSLPLCLMKDKDKPSENCSEKDDVILEHYLTSSRINVNVRQVLAPGKEFPDEGLQEE